MQRNVRLQMLGVLAVGVLLGWLTIPLVGQEKKPEPDVKPARFR